MHAGTEMPPTIVDGGNPSRDPGVPPAMDRGQLVVERQQRLHRYLGEAEFDAVVLTSPEAVDYATGYRSVFGSLHRDYPMAAVVSESDCWLLCPASDAAAAEDAGVAVSDLVPHGTFFIGGGERFGLDGSQPRSLDASIADCLARLGVPNLGVEGSLGHIARIRDAVPEAVDATSWMMTVRASKTRIEQQRLRMAALIAEESIEAALAVAAMGVSERELHRVVAEVMVSRGAHPSYIVVTAGAGSALGDAQPTERTCQPGDLLRFDLGCQVDGYWSDIARTAVLGEVTKLQELRYGALLEGLLHQVEIARAGMPASDLFARTVHTVEGKGLAPYQRHHVGHAIGLSVYETPVISPSDRGTLEVGGVFSFETPYYELGWGGMMVEDTGVLTDSGFELFTSIDRSLRVVGL